MPKQTFRRIAWWTQAVLLTIAVVALGYCAYVLADTWLFQRQAIVKVEPPGPAPAPSVTRVAPPPKLGDVVGRVEIPRLGLSVVVAEGTDEPTLRRAAGHILGTAFPGSPGNVGIAGHRDTLFRPLRTIEQNDLIVLTTEQGEFRYRVVSTKIVNPSDVSVLNPAPPGAAADEILTLVTCHPFYFIGPAPNRFIVRAERVAGRT
jgi:sortase A